MTDIDRFIEALARQLWAVGYSKESVVIRHVLDRELRPVLESGELMRPYFHYKNPAAEAWDAAIKKLAEESK